MCISIEKTSKHKGEIKTHQRRKIWKKINPNKKKYVHNVHLKTSCNKSLGRLKESRKIMFHGKAVLLVVPWVRVDSDLFISLLFDLRFSWRYCIFENKHLTRNKEKEINGTSLTKAVLWFSWCAHLCAWLHYYKEK